MFLRRPLVPAVALVCVLVLLIGASRTGGRQQQQPSASGDGPVNGIGDPDHYHHL
jgi:hypothetical protein